MLTQYHEFLTITSTQDWIKENISSLDLNHFHVIFSQEQTKGRGRFNRTWHSPKKLNLYVSYCFKLPTMKHAFSPMSLVVGLSISKALQNLNMHLKLKWPNDLFIHEKKVGGVLIETIDYQQHKIAIIGFGLNVNMTHEQLNKIPTAATSLFMEYGHQYSLEILMQEIEQQFKKDWQIFEKEGFAPFEKEFEARSILKGKHLKLEYGHQIVEGKYVRIDSSGALVLALEDKEQKSFVSGEIKSWE